MVPTLGISVSNDGDPFIAGQSYNLTCTVTLENTADTPTVEWLGPNNNPLSNSSDITVERLPVNNFTYTTTLHFTTLRTSHGGQYSCQVTLGSVNNTAAMNITVLSKFFHLVMVLVSLCLCALYAISCSSSSECDCYN